MGKTAVLRLAVQSLFGCLAYAASWLDKLRDEIVRQWYISVLLHLVFYWRNREDLNGGQSCASEHPRD